MPVLGDGFDGVPMPIQDLARDDVVTATPDTSVRELAQQMQAESVGSIVITDGARPQGIVTDRDLMTRVLAEDVDPASMTSSDVMSTDLCQLNPEDGFYQAAQTMSEHGVRRLPVCNENNELVGIISADDMTELIAEETQHLASVIQAQRPPY